MTATISTRPPARSSTHGRRQRGSIHGRCRRGSGDSLLRLAIRADATGCAGLGLLIAMVADPLSRVTGLSVEAEWVGGAALVGYGAALYGLAAASFIRRIGVGIVIANVVFALIALAVLAAGVLPLTGAGVVLLMATVAATLGLACVQYLGVRRLA